ncbi:hypothetical protein DITRI_Ditri16bG0065800 [Diplodiscus trichospermus]
MTNPKIVYIVEMPKENNDGVKGDEGMRLEMDKSVEILEKEFKKIMKFKRRDGIEGEKEEENLFVTIRKMETGIEVGSLKVGKDTEIASSNVDTCRITFVYGAPVFENRRIIWERLISKAKGIKGAWCCIKDFNDIGEQSEKEGERLKENRKIETFRNMLEECKLNNMCFQGQRFTWFEIREGQCIKERLDRAVVNVEWMETYPMSMRVNLPANGSDHSPIILWIEKVEKKGIRRFKFGANWVEVKECKQIIVTGWSKEVEGFYGFRVVQKLRNCRKKLMEWRKKKG